MCSCWSTVCFLVISCQVRRSSQSFSIGEPDEAMYKAAATSSKLPRSHPHVQVFGFCSLSLDSFGLYRLASFAAATAAASSLNPLSVHLMKFDSIQRSAHFCFLPSSHFHHGCSVPSLGTRQHVWWNVSTTKKYHSLGHMMLIKQHWMVFIVKVQTQYINRIQVSFNWIWYGVGIPMDEILSFGLGGTDGFPLKVLPTVCSTQETKMLVEYGGN